MVHGLRFRVSTAGYQGRGIKPETSWSGRKLLQGLSNNYFTICNSIYAHTHSQTRLEETNEQRGFRVH